MQASKCGDEEAEAQKRFTLWWELCGEKAVRWGSNPKFSVFICGLMYSLCLRASVVKMLS
jgi:hypothetical protein